MAEKSERLKNVNQTDLNRNDLHLSEEKRIITVVSRWQQQKSIPLNQRRSTLITAMINGISCKKIKRFMQLSLHTFIRSSNSHDLVFVLALHSQQAWQFYFKYNALNTHRHFH